MLNAVHMWSTMVRGTLPPSPRFIPAPPSSLLQPIVRGGCWCSRLIETGLLISSGMGKTLLASDSRKLRSGPKVS